jgi:hypothetical protein
MQKYTETMYDLNQATYTIVKIMDSEIGREYRPILERIFDDLTKMYCEISIAKKHLEKKPYKVMNISEVIQ